MKASATDNTFQANYDVSFTATPPASGGTISQYKITLTKSDPKKFFQPKAENVGGNFVIDWSIKKQGGVPYRTIEFVFSLGAGTSGFQFSGFLPNPQTGSGLNFGKVSFPNGKMQVTASVAQTVAAENMVYSLTFTNPAVPKATWTIDPSGDIDITDGTGTTKPAGPRTP